MNILHSWGWEVQHVHEYAWVGMCAWDVRLGEARCGMIWQGLVQVVWPGIESLYMFSLATHKRMHRDMDAIGCHRMASCFNLEHLTKSQLSTIISHHNQPLVINYSMIINH